MTPWVIGNWKLNPATPDAVMDLVAAIAAQVAAEKTKGLPSCHIMVAPSFLHLNVAAIAIQQAYANNQSYVNQQADIDKDLTVSADSTLAQALPTSAYSTPLKLAGQDVSGLTGETGAYTGDVSAEQLRHIGAKWVILGHSERRQYYAEDNALLLQKLLHCAQHDLGVVFCIGESAAAFAAGQTKDTLVAQLQVLASFIQAMSDQAIPIQTTSTQAMSTQNDNDIAAVNASAVATKSALGKNALSKLIVAYEPVWAIGTGKVASVTQVEAVHGFIREQLCSFDPSLAQTPIVYGGSVKPDNAKEFAASPSINGVLVGGAALAADSFVSIVHSFCA